MCIYLSLCVENIHIFSNVIKCWVLLILIKIRMFNVLRDSDEKLHNDVIFFLCKLIRPSASKITIRSIIYASINQQDSTRGPRIYSPLIK